MKLIKCHAGGETFNVCKQSNQSNNKKAKPTAFIRGEKEECKTKLNKQPPQPKTKSSGQKYILSAVYRCKSTAHQYPTRVTSSPEEEWRSHC